MTNIIYGFYHSVVIFKRLLDSDNMSRFDLHDDVVVVELLAYLEDRQVLPLDPREVLRSLRQPQNTLVNVRRNLQLKYE